MTIIVIGLSACNKSEPPHLKAIPANATFVVAIEGKQLIKKSGLENLNEYTFFKELRSEIKDDDEGKVIMGMIDDFIKNPKGLGLGLDQAFLFGMKHRDDFFVAMTFKVSNESKLEANIKKLIKEEIISEDIENEEGYKIIRIPAYNNKKVDEAIIAWNKNLLIVGGRLDTYGTTEKNLDYAEFFNPPKDKSIISNADFKEFYNRKYDIGFWSATYDNIFDAMNLSKGEKKQINSILGNLSDTHLHGYLNFDAGELKFSCMMSPKSKIKEYYKEYSIAKKDFNNDLFKAFPDKPLLAFKMAIDIPSYLKMIKTMSKEMKEVEEMYDEIMGDRTIKAIINGLGGDLLLSVYGFDKEIIPQAGFAFTVENKEIFDKIRTLTEEEGGLEWDKKGDYYETTDFGIPIYAAFKNNTVFVTNDKTAVSAFTGKGLSKSLSASFMNKKCFYVNLDIKSYPKDITELIRDEIGKIYEREYEWYGYDLRMYERYRNYGYHKPTPPVDKTEEWFGMAMKFLEPYKDFSISMTNDYEAVFSLKLKDSRTNVLEQIIKNFDELLKKYLLSEEKSKKSRVSEAVEIEPEVEAEEDYDFGYEYVDVEAE